MHSHPPRITAVVVLFSAMLALGLVQGNGSVDASPPHAANPAIVAAPLAAPVINYQGRLLDPATNAPKANGNYPMAFVLYAADTGGAPLWTENKSVAVSNGLFSTLLGDTTPLNVAVFNSQALWLGVTVGGDPEMTPRQRIGYAAYAMYALNADTLDGQEASAFVQTNGPSAITANSTSAALSVAQSGTGPAIAAQGSISADKLTYTTPRTHYFSITGDVFRPIASSGVEFSSGTGQGGAYMTVGTQNTMIAPITLPHGATVTKFTAYVYDADAALNLTVRMARHGWDVYAFPAMVSSSGNAGLAELTNTSVSLNPINNRDYSYEVRVNSTGGNWSSAGSNLSIRGVVIEYTLNEAQ